MIERRLLMHSADDGVVEAATLALAGSTEPYGFVEER